MSRFDHTAVAGTLSALDLRPSQRKLADHWLSLWKDRDLPERASFHPSRLKALLPALAIYDVMPERSVTVRLAGTLYNDVLGLEITGMDWIAMVPHEFQQTRLRLFSDMARGGIGRGFRSIELETGPPCDCHEFFLPFRADASTGVHPILGLVDWNPQQRFTKIKSRAQAMGASTAFEIIPLPRTED
jgi:hypothetical protein